LEVFPEFMLALIRTLFGPAGVRIRESTLRDIPTLLERTVMVSAVANGVTAMSRQRRVTIQWFVKITTVISNPLKPTYNFGNSTRYSTWDTTAKCKFSGQKRLER
jgi:hypothetical protein